MSAASPGAYCPSRDLWGPFEVLSRRLPEGSLVVVDRRVARLHPAVPAALRARSPRATVSLVGGEGAKTFAALEKILLAGLALPRSGTLLAIGGGTIGDVSTVAAHLIKRGVRLVHVPSTLLAAVDSSLGGKGAVDLSSDGRVVKNPAGVFHYASEAWICPELFTTLSAAQLREGALEAWKMVASLDAARFRRYRRRAPVLARLVKDARELKQRICARDPYELEGVRPVLNFGHSFGHVLESLSGFSLAHGDAVGLGMLCALDVGRTLGITPASVAEEVEAALVQGPGVLGRRRIARVLKGISDAEILSLLAADKKSGATGALRMVLLTALGEWALTPVGADVWRPLVQSWAQGIRP